MRAGPSRRGVGRDVAGWRSSRGSAGPFDLTSQRCSWKRYNTRAGPSGTPLTLANTKSLSSYASAHSARSAVCRAAGPPQDFSIPPLVPIVPGKGDEERERLLLGAMAHDRRQARVHRRQVGQADLCARDGPARHRARRDWGRWRALRQPGEQQRPSPRPSQVFSSTRASRGKSAARSGRYNDMWLRMGLRSIDRQVRIDRNCASFSTGQIRDCLRREPCVRMKRSLGTISDGRGGTIALSVAWVRMPTSRGGRHFKRLIDTPGSGGIAPIEAEVGVRFTGKHRATRRSGPLVVIAEATTGGGQRTSAMLNAVAEVEWNCPRPKAESDATRCAGYSAYLKISVG